MPRVCLFAIGNELMNGEVRDKNLFTLSQHLTQLGFSVEYTVIGRDDPASIVTVLQFLLGQNPDVLICSGGLGPTQDDLTLAALAQALHRPLEYNEKARALVEIHYNRLVSQQYLTHHGPEAARQKMATLPQGAQPLPNPIGTAPGVTLEHQGICIYVLPGVPAELEAILHDSIVPALHQRFELGAWAESSLFVHCNDEAEVAPLLSEIAQRHPDVYLKSLARPFPSASKEGLRVIAATIAPEPTIAQQAVEQTLEDFEKAAKRAGLPISHPDIS